MFNIPTRLISKDWVNLNPKTNPNSADLYYNERLNAFSLSPVFEKEALPELYELFLRNFKLKLKLPFLFSDPDFCFETTKLDNLDKRLEKPVELEDYADTDIFLRFMAMTIEENHEKESQESKNKQRGKMLRGLRMVGPSNEYPENERTMRGSEATVEKKFPLVLKASNLKENTLKIRRKVDKRPVEEGQPLVPLQTALANYKEFLCDEKSAFEEFSKFRIEDQEALRSFYVVNKNDVAIFYEVFQRVHKVKPLFTYSHITTDSKTMGKLTINGKAMLQVLETCKKDAKKKLCSLALEIFCPSIKNFQIGAKRKSHQVKGLMDFNCKAKRKKVKGANEEEKEIENKAAELEKKSIDYEEKFKDPAEFMKGFENISKILGRDVDGNLEQKETLETLNDQLFENDPFDIFMQEIFQENSVYEPMMPLEDEPIRIGDAFGSDICAANNNDNDVVVIEAQKDHQKTNIQNNTNKNVNNNNNNIHNNNSNTMCISSSLTLMPQNPTNPNPNKNTNNPFLAKPNFGFNHPNYPQSQIPLLVSQNGERSHPPSLIKPFPMVNKNHENRNNMPHKSKNQDRQRKPNPKPLGNEKKHLFNPPSSHQRCDERDIFQDPGKEEQQLEEELTKACGKKIVSIDDFLRDMGSAQKNYPINLAIDFLEKLLKLYSLKNHENYKIFTIKDKDIVRISIKRKDSKGEVCCVRNENPSLAKYFCLLDFFKKTYGERSTLNEILVNLLKKNYHSVATSALYTTTTNKPKDDKIPNSETKGVLDDIESFQYSRNTINNKRMDEDDYDSSDEFEEDHSKRKKGKSDNINNNNRKKSEKGVQIKENNEHRVHNSSSQREKDIPRKIAMRGQDRAFEEIDEDSDENNIILID